MSQMRVAVLVDGDNINASHSAEILSQARKLGRVDIARVYAGAHPSCGWLDTPGFRPIHAGAGKNAADVLLCIDTMELALTIGVDTFVVATSDGDFSHLAHKLRERGSHVLGLGEAKAPEGFRLACSEFEVLEKPTKMEEARGGCVASELDHNIRIVIGSHSQQGRGMKIADLGAKMRTKHGTQISSHPERSWRAYLGKRPTLYDLDPRGPEAFVRFRREGFGAA